MRTEYTPLTPEEQEFATKNHYMVENYLRIRRLPVDEWYDVVIFRFLLAVKQYLTIPRLQQYKFRTIAYYAMRSAIGNEYEKQKRRISTISLDEVIPGTEDLTYAESITYKNLDYLKEDCSLNIYYNVKVPEIPRAPKSEETIAIEAFLANEPKAENMCFEYDSYEEARKKANSLYSYRSRYNLKGVLDIKRNKNQIFIIRLSQKGRCD